MNIITPLLPFWRFLSYFASFSGIFRTLFFILFAIKEISSIYYDTAIRKFNEPFTTLALLIVGIIFSILITFPWREGWKNRLIRIEKYLRPAIILWSIPCVSFPWLLIAIFIISWVIFRIAQEVNLKLPELSNKLGWYIVSVISGIMLLWGMFLQKHAYDSHFFIWGDWNQYVDCYHYLLSGKARIIQWFSCQLK